MEYFKRVEVSEMEGMPESEKQEVSEKVVSMICDRVNEIVKVNSLARKLEVFVSNLSVKGLSALVDKVSISDIYHRSITYAIESILKRIEEHKKLPKAYKRLLEEIEEAILKNPLKSFKSKGTNHIIRQMLRIGHSTERIKREIKDMPIEYFLEDTTRIVTYSVYMDCVEEERERIVKYLVKSLDSSELRGYRGFIYEKVCSLASKEQLDEIFQRIKSEIGEISLDRTGNYFMQKFIQVYPVGEIYRILEENIHSFPSNSNVVHSILMRAAEEGDRYIVESAIERIFKKDTVMSTLLFHETGGFDSKSYKLAIRLMAVESRYQGMLQMQCMGLYERYWLFNRIGQKVIIGLLQSKLDKAVCKLLTSTMTREFIGICKTKGGEELLQEIEKVSNKETKKKIDEARKGNKDKKDKL